MMPATQGKTAIVPATSANSLSAFGFLELPGVEAFPPAVDARFPIAPARDGRRPAKFSRKPCDTKIQGHMCTTLFTDPLQSAGCNNRDEDLV